MEKIKPLKEIELERTYNASPKKIWQALTDPEMLKKWWGPNNVTIPECEVDLKIPGKFYIVMEAGEAMGQYKGIKWPMLAEFTVIETNSKLFYTAKAWTEGQKEGSTISQTTKITLTEEMEGPDAPIGTSKTKLNLRATIYKADPGAEMAAEGMKYGFTQQLEKLNDFLAAK